MSSPIRCRPVSTRDCTGCSTPRSSTGARTFTEMRHAPRAGERGGRAGASLEDAEEGCGPPLEYQVVAGGDRREREGVVHQVQYDGVGQRVAGQRVNGAVEQAEDRDQQEPARTLVPGPWYQWKAVKISAASTTLSTAAPRPPPKSIRSRCCTVPRKMISSQRPASSIVLRTRSTASRGRPRMRSNECRLRTECVMRSHKGWSTSFTRKNKATPAAIITSACRQGIALRPNSTRQSRRPMVLRSTATAAAKRVSQVGATRIVP